MMPAHISRRKFLPWTALGCGAGLLMPGLLDSANRPSHITVQRGDSLFRLSKKYSLSVAQLKLWNGLTSDLIYTGQKLWLEPAYRNLPVSEITKPKIKSNRWQNIIAHHSATPNGNAKIFDQHHRVRQGREHGLAYHFVFGNGTNSRDGKVEIGGRWLKQVNGGHVSNVTYNANSIGICLVGNFERTHPSKAQLVSLIELTDYLKNRVFSGKLKFLVHNEIEKTLCPGRYFPSTRLRKLFA